MVSNGELQRFIEPAKSDGSVSFIVIGDWGRRGSFNQSIVAYQVLVPKNHYYMEYSYNIRFFLSSYNDVLNLTVLLINYVFIIITDG